MDLNALDGRDSGGLLAYSNVSLSATVDAFASFLMPTASKPPLSRIHRKGASRWNCGKDRLLYIPEVGCAETSAPRFRENPGAHVV